MAGGGGDDWDDIEAEGLAARASGTAARPGAATPAREAASSYAGGGLSMDDDPFADDASGGSLELDLPGHHQAHQPKPPRSLPVSAPAAPSRPPVSHPPAFSPPSSGQPSVVPSRNVPSGPPARGGASLQPPAPGTRPSLPSRPSVPGSQGGASGSFRPQEASIPPRNGPQSLPARYPATSADPASLIARFPSPPTKLHETPAYAMRVLLRQYELRQDLASLRRRRSPDVPLYERAIYTHDERTFRLGLVITGAALTVATFLFFLPVILRFLRNS